MVTLQGSLTNYRQLDIVLLLFSH